MHRVTVTSGSPHDAFRILCVCTGNVYRSRIAADEFNLRLKARLGPVAANFSVLTAGTEAVDGQLLTSGQHAALGRLGVRDDLGPTRALKSSDIVAADLILAAAYDHRRAVLQLVPTAIHRTFTLAELARLASTTPYRIRLAQVLGAVDLPLRAREAVAAASSHRALTPGDGRDEIRDPVGQSESTLRTVATQVREAARLSIDAILGPNANFPA